MNDLLEFLTTKEIMTVYLISGIVCLICLIVYMYEKNNERIRRKHNTKELNKLVEEVRERLPEEEEIISYDEPVLEVLEENNEVYSVSELLEATDKKEEAIVLNNEEEELEYTTIEPDQVSARLELERLTKELEAREQEELNESPDLTLFEQEQEASAIISIDELLKRGKELYESNEKIQYEDEGNEPISIQDLEERIKSQNVEEKVEVIEPKVEVIEPKIETIKEEKKEVNKETVTSKFKSTPFISPIFGIEKDPKDNNLELENTANYDKLDEQIKKSNEFVMSLKEFQSNLD